MRAASSFLEVARGLALEAGARIMELLKSPLVRTRKPDYSLVTNADHEADRIIRLGLRQAFPDHAILTEESGMDGSPHAEYVWVVDPLDGTRAYVKDVPGYSVMIGLLKKGKPFAGIVFDPLEGDLYEAALGAGAFHTFQNIRQRAHVSVRRDLKDMPVITSTGFPDALYRPIREQLAGVWLPAVNSVGIKVGFMVRQLADIYLNHHSVHYWDTCAPQIILEEAGGIITFTDGQPLTYDLTSAMQHPGPTVATNGTRHKDLLQIVGQLMQPASRSRSDETA